MSLPEVASVVLSSPLDPATLQQSGWGLAGGVSLGRRFPLGDGEAANSYGILLSLVQPKYNPGTGAFRVEQLNVFVLPVPGFFSIVLGYQINFG